MVYDSPPERDGVIARIKSSTAAQLCIVAAVAVACLLLGAVETARRKRAAEQTIVI